MPACHQSQKERPREAGWCGTFYVRTVYVSPALRRKFRGLMTCYAFAYAVFSRLAGLPMSRGSLDSPTTAHTRWYDSGMYAQKFRVDVLILGEREPCPLEWLDQFCMRNFTNSPDFDDTLPVADGLLEASFRLTPERFAEGFGAWLTQRGKGEGEPVIVEITRA